MLKVYYVTCSVWGLPLEARGGGGFKLGVSSGILLNYLLPMPVEIPITLPNLKKTPIEEVEVVEKPPVLHPAH